MIQTNPVLDDPVIDGRDFVSCPPVPSARSKDVKDSSTLASEVAVAFKDVQWWLGTLLTALPVVPARASELSDSLRASYRVCWQVFEVLKSPDLSVGVRHVPRSGSMQRLLLAAKAQGVAADTVEGLRSALSRFDDVAKSHAGDRDAFATMVGSMGGRAAAGGAGTLACRRTAFRQDSQLWGSQIAVQYVRVIIRRSSTVAGRVDEARTAVKAGLQCLRAGVQPIIHGERNHNSEDTQPIPLDTEPLDADTNQQCGAPLLAQFSTRPLPRLVKIVAEDGWVYSGVDTEQLGLSGAVNVASGTLLRNFRLTTLNSGQLAHWSVQSFSSPTELAVLEMAVHRPSFGRIVPALRTVPSRGHSFLAQLTAEPPQLPSTEEWVALGPADLVVPAVEVKDYARLSAYAFDHLGWDPSDFDLFRVTIPYPILNSMAVMWFPVAGA
jgi:hypothetical protein